MAFLRRMVLNQIRTLSETPCFSFAPTVAACNRANQTGLPVYSYRCAAGNVVFRVFIYGGTMSAPERVMLTAILVCSWIGLATGLSLAILRGAARRSPL